MNSFWNPEDKLSERRKWEEETIIKKHPKEEQEKKDKGIKRYFKTIKKLEKTF